MGGVSDMDKFIDKLKNIVVSTTGFKVNKTAIMIIITEYEKYRKSIDSIKKVG